MHKGLWIDHDKMIKVFSSRKIHRLPTIPLPSVQEIPDRVLVDGDPRSLADIA